MATTLFLFLLLAPDAPAPTLAYRFEKGLVYTDAQTRVLRLDAQNGANLLRWHHELELEMRRTVLAVDRTGHPTAERVEVAKFRRKVVLDPEAKPGTQEFPSHGKRYVWKRLKTRWGLFAGEDEVTKRHPHLVEQLKTWRDARLPREPVAVGGKWSVNARTFLESVGLPVPRGAEGVAEFRLEKIEEGVATIPFEFHVSYPSNGAQHDETAKGVWRFSVARGADVGFVYEGSFKLDLGDRGVGNNRLERRVTRSR